MGNSAGRESRAPSQPSSNRSPTSSPFPGSPSFAPPSSERGRGAFYSSRPGRGSRHDISIFGLSGSGSDRDNANLEQRRETKQEREARRLEKERVARAKERERSMREENVDGGYLVTLGTYVGIEDFSKPIVRQLQIDRRLAPFWRGLNDHSSSWTEHQLVAAARGKPIPAPDEIPTQDESPTVSEKGQHSSVLGSGVDLDRSTSPIIFRTLSSENDDCTIPTSLPHDAGGGRSVSPSNQSSTPGPLFRGRAKTLASMTSARSNSQQMEISPQETRLPRDPNINGQPVEAFLYKDVAECPICFLYYPLHLNQTRCCDQPICSECFVQIKRPDPHPPEHNDPNENPSSNQIARTPDEDEQLVSEPANCPFCVQPEFGITYKSPPFRRGLAYASQAGNSGLSTSPSTQSPRRRGQSLSANSPGVITTDMVRPDWAKKLSDARSHQARRSAAATALHTAAYMMNGSSGFPGLGRRRRPMLLDGSGIAGQRLENMNPAHMEQMLAILEGQESSRRERRGNHDLFPGRVSSRSSRTEDLEEIMMMEAIRQSLAAEEERKKKEDKEAAKEAKKEEKKRAKEQKKADKAAKKNGGSYSHSSSANNSGFFSVGSSSSPFSESNQSEAKGKAKVSSRESSRLRGPAPLGFTALDEPSSVLHNQSYVKPRSDPQKHLEQSRANLGSDAQPQGIGGQLPRQSSFPSSTNSSLADSSPFQPITSSDSSLTTSEGLPSTPGLGGNNRSNDSNPSGFNFGSLAEMIGKEGVQMSDNPEDVRNHSPLGRSEAKTRGREGSGESSSDSPSPPRYLDEAADAGTNTRAGFGDGKHNGSGIVTSVVDEGSKGGETH